MTCRRSDSPGSIIFALTVLAGSACGGGGDRTGAAPAAAATKITVTPTSDARADARTYLAKLCPKPIGGELNFMAGRDTPTPSSLDLSRRPAGSR